MDLKFRQAYRGSTPRTLANFAIEPHGVAVKGRAGEFRQSFRRGE